MVRMAGSGSDDSAARLVPVARELAVRGVAVDLLSRAESAPSAREVAAGVTCHEITAGPAASVPRSRLLSLTDAFGEAVADLAGRNGSRYDVIHAFGRHSGLAALPVALELAVPFVQSFPAGAERAGTEAKTPRRACSGPAVAGTSPVRRERWSRHRRPRWSG